MGAQGQLFLKGVPSVPFLSSQASARTQRMQTIPQNMASLWSCVILLVFCIALPVFLYGLSSLPEGPQAKQGQQRDAQIVQGGYIHDWLTHDAYLAEAAVHIEHFAGDGMCQV